MVIDLFRKDAMVSHCHRRYEIERNVSHIMVAIVVWVFYEFRYPFNFVIRNELWT